MKKLHLLSIFLCFSLGIISCKKDNKKPDKGIQGTWKYAHPLDNNLMYSADYNFGDKGNVEITGKSIDPKDNAVKGYWNRQIGDYELQGDSIIFKELEFYGVPGNSATSFQNLEYKTTDKRIAWKLVFNQKQDTATLIHAPCKPNENCIGFIKLIRTKK